MKTLLALLLTLQASAKNFDLQLSGREQALVPIAVNSPRGARADGKMVEIGKLSDTPHKAAGENQRTINAPTRGKSAEMSDSRKDGTSLIDRIQQKEDATANPATIGDKGKSRGMYQLSEASWCDVSAIRKSKGLPVYPWKTGAHSPIAREYAVQYLALVRNDLRAALRRSPTNAELYCSYALGLSGFKERGFLLKNCPAWLQRKAKDL